jgi:NAD(P)-dependent dehydrogenase (short-subunit alcohol dehydrogenase family)
MPQVTATATAMPSHAGQRVLITAAASGIGLVTAQAFVAAGARVYICDIDAAALTETLLRYPQLAGQVCDVADEAQVVALFQAALNHLGGLDILVNNAGVAGPTALLEEMQFADWQRCLAVNLDSCFLCARAAAPILRRQGSGSIVNMSSTGGQYGFARRAPYAAAKWAIRGLTRTLAQELGPANVRVNCICPGSVSGERIDRVIAAEAAKTGQSQAEVREGLTAISSLRTLISPEDIASTILFLTSAAGARISGQDITVDGHTETL